MCMCMECCVITKANYIPLCTLALHDLRQMADRSFAWAEKRGLLRTNQVHGEQEARLVLEDFFQHTSETGESTNLRAQGTLEARLPFE